MMRFAILVGLTHWLRHHILVGETPTRDVKAVGTAGETAIYLTCGAGRR